MRTATPRRNPRASARAARLEMEKARQEAERIQAYGPAEPTPEPPPIQEPVMAEPAMPTTPAEETPLQVPEGDLATLVHEINTRYALAERNERVAEDHRLVMALQLAKAKNLCTEAKIPFKAWAEKHLSQSYQTARKMAVIGASPNPREALEAIRARTATAMKKVREQQAIAAPAVSRETPTPAATTIPTEPATDGHMRVPAGAHDVASEAPLRSDRAENAVAMLKELRVPDFLAALKEVLPLQPREAVIEALRSIGFVVVGFSLETAAE